MDVSLIERPDLRKSLFGKPGLNSRSILFRREPLWRPASVHRPPADVRSWLLESGSLTARLRRAVGAGFGVRLLRQGWGRPFQGESEFWDLPTRRNAWLREVLLQCDDRPLVLARTVIPPGALRGAHCGLARLGSRPLGEVLFTYRNLQRTRLEVARIAPEDWRNDIARTYGMEGSLWGRRSLYRVGQDSLLVCEFFLPAVLSLSEPQCYE